MGKAAVNAPQSKTWRRFGTAPANAKRLGLRWQSGSGDGAFGRTWRVVLDCGGSTHIYTNNTSRGVYWMR